MAGIRFAVGPGEKAPGDLVLWWRAPDGWHRVPMAAIALMVDFIVENEEHLRVTARPYWRQTAADFLMGYLHHAIARGWESADKQLRTDRAWRSDKEEAA